MFLIWPQKRSTSTSKPIGHGSRNAKCCARGVKDVNDGSKIPPACVFLLPLHVKYVWFPAQIIGEALRCLLGREVVRGLNPDFVLLLAVAFSVVQNVLRKMKDRADAPSAPSPSLRGGHSPSFNKLIRDEKARRLLWVVASARLGDRTRVAVPGGLLHVSTGAPFSSAAAIEQPRYARQRKAAYAPSE
jgi:hypothetical protein